MYKSPYHNIKKSDLWIRGAFVVIAGALVIIAE
jgi:hypothetical protein